MKTIQVVAAIIKDDNKILATQRGYGDYKGFWEFPGGKIELNELKEEALIREIKEELGVKIKVGELVEIVEFDYPTFHLVMYCFFANIIEGKIELSEHSDARWLMKNTLDSVEWLEADIQVIEKLKSIL